MIRIVEYLKKMISPTIVYVYTKVAMDLLVDTFSNIPHRLDLRTRVFLGGGGQWTRYNLEHHVFSCYAYPTEKRQPYLW